MSSSKGTSSDISQNLYFCDGCLNINNIGSYSKEKLASEYIELKEKLDNLRKSGKDLVIENICFSGGGIRTLSYIGALQVLEALGLLSHIKRFATSSAGTIIALLLAFKYTVTEMYTLLFKDQSHYLDRSVWSVSGLLGILKGNYGIHSGQTIVKEMQKLVNDSFDRDFPAFRKEMAEKSKGFTEYQPTFSDLYQKYWDRAYNYRN